MLQVSLSALLKSASTFIRSERQILSVLIGCLAKGGEGGTGEGMARGGGRGGGGGVIKYFLAKPIKGLAFFFLFFLHFIGIFGLT